MDGSQRSMLQECSVWVAVVVWMVASVVCCRNNWSNNLWYNNFWSYILNYWDSYWGKWSSSSGSIKVLLELYLCSSNFCSISYVRFSSGNFCGISKVGLGGSNISCEFNGHSNCAGQEAESDQKLHDDDIAWNA